ncbi:imelysin family protein [Ekhidna sp.]
MKKMRLLSLGLAIVLSSLLVACSDDDPGQSGDNFDRGAMLVNWADNIIVPGYQTYVSELTDLGDAVDAFSTNPSTESLNNARDAWYDANVAWQHVALFEIGKAEELTLINFTNVYPTNTTDLVATIESGSYDLTSVNRQDEQGFPAIEYLLYGIEADDQAIIDLYSQETGNKPYATYLTDLSDRLATLAQTVLDDWNNGYRDEFVNNNGTDATASVNKLTNDYIFYYEKHLRAGKIGIPAGVFSSDKQADKVEGLYSGRSKDLFMEGLDAMKDFFNGKSPNSNLPVEGEGFKSYLDFLNTVSEGEDLGELINAQLEVARAKAETLSENFSDQVNTDNTVMLETYDELQKNVVYLKVDMLQALNIRVDFVDADGD